MLAKNILQGVKLNKWTEEQMQAALEEYERLLQKEGGNKFAVSISKLARDYRLPLTTLWKRVNKHVTGTGHRSGGKNDPKILSKGNNFFI